MSANSSNLFVVGIGFSAGGLLPLQELLHLASCHGSMCFIVASHVSRITESDLVKILSRATNMTAVQAEDGMKLENCKLYTIPPNNYIRVEDQKIRLSERPEKVPNNCVDFLFESLAKEYGQNAVGVVLSGGSVGHDGSRGVEAIKKVRGHTYAQKPETAQFRGMPEAAIATGCIDSVLTPHEIGHELSLVSWAQSHT
jgi:two-component system CheB/CheR fusion protein